MAGLFLVRERDQDFADTALAAARAQFARHGFSGLTERALPGWRLLHAPHIIGGPESMLVEEDGLVAVAGTFTCDGKMGRPALRALLDMAPLGRPDWSRIGGQFVALVHKGGRTFLFTDYFAAFQLFHDPERRLFSTSFLGAASALPRLSFDPQSVYEFAFNVVPIGNDTVFSELKLLGPDSIAELSEAGVRLHAAPKPLPERPESMALGDRIALHRDRLASVVEAHAGSFDELFTPLSGGLDSRLVLAALRERGRNPNVYVYGPPGSEDVRIARQVAAGEGIALAEFDKEAYRPVEPDEFPELVERNFQEFDAVPNFGDLFENGGNAAARDARHAGGALCASGGCGEIYRDFFMLPDRPIRAARLARSFFARYSAGDVTAAFDARDFLLAIEDKILHALGTPGVRSPLPRALIEQAYPRVRCRSFFGKEISIEGRYGAYLMPFLDHRVVAGGIALPMRLKHAGRFEAMLLHAIDPALARHPSAYGHDFASPPGLRHRFEEWSTRVRPAWVRQKSYDLRRKLGLVPSEYSLYLTPEYAGRAVDLELPIMRRFFRPEAIGDKDLLCRIACLEYLGAKLGSRLAA